MRDQSWRNIDLEVYCPVSLLRNGLLAEVTYDPRIHQFAVFTVHHSAGVSRSMQWLQVRYINQTVHSVTYDFLIRFVFSIVRSFKRLVTLFNL